MAKRTQKLDMPVVDPRMRGPRILPSNCCSTRIKIRNCNVVIGETMSRINALGIAPTKGPKNGITFVTPTKTLIKSA